MTAWPLVTLADVASPEKRAIISGPFGSNIGKRFFLPSGIPVIRGNNLVNLDAQFMDEGFVYISAEKAAALNCWANPDDLIFTAAGSLGQVGLIPRDGRYPQYVISNKQLRITLDTTKILPAFAYYHFSTPEMRAYVIGQNKGSSVPLITLGVLRSLPIPKPPIGIQRKVVGILSAYDALIENNNRRIALLEESAQRIYGEWFVDFRYPGHENTPMLDSPHGPIPTGWSWRELRELADEIRVGVEPGAVEPSTPYVGLEHMPERSIAIADWGTAADAGSRKFAFKAGDILFGKIRPYFHKVAVPPVAGICSTDAVVIRERGEGLGGLVLAVVSSDAFVQEAVQTSQGTKMPRANWTVLERYNVAVPPTSLIKHFDELMSDIVGTIHRLVMSDRNLRAARDLLLPRLVSGELDVADLDIAMPEATA